LDLVAIVDDHPAVDSLEGVPVHRATEAPSGLDAILVSSEAREGTLLAAAERAFQPRGIPVHAIYGNPRLHPLART
ncbi:MAG: hypothetical protein VYC34_11865, partial [Planctomycetota bacterium]|nr:hypothetical protein [Planctomycetota bacterium]